MAQMIPSSFPDGWKSEAEHVVFEMLRDGLSSEWSCLHSVGLAKHRRKVWAEIDFVLVGPPGVFCLEVKGGYLGREDGIWIFRNRHGRENRKAEGPFEQVGSAAGALKFFFRTNQRRVLRSIVGHGVVMPDVACLMRGPDVDPEIVLDKTKIGDGIGAFIEQLVSVWGRRFSDQHREEPRTLSRQDRTDILSSLRGDFDLVPSLSTRIGWVSDELVRLTSQQSEYLARLEENPRILIRGGAGTGKTMLALEDASRAARSGKRVLFLCYNRLLAQSLNRRSHHGVMISTLHSFMWTLIDDAGLKGDLPDADESDLYEVFFPLLSLEALASHSPYDYLVVDEGQDVLLNNYADVLDALLLGGLEGGCWRIFYDPNQNIFDGVDVPAMERILSTHPTQYSLTVNCRNTEQIATATSMLSGCSLVEASAQGPAIELLWYRDLNDQRRAVSNHVRRLLSQGVRPPDIVVLSSKVRKDTCLSEGWDGTVSAALVDVADMRPDDQGAIGFCTVAAFKGLEADAIILLDAVNASASSRYLTYAGASRAKVLLAILLDQAQNQEIVSLYAEFGTNLSGSDDERRSS